MKLHHALSLMCLSSVLIMTGCAETKTFGSSVGKGASELVTSVLEGISQGLGGTTNSNQKQQSTSNQTANESLTDWTPYLQTMLSDCSYPSINKGLPAKYRASVVKVTQQGNPNIEGEEVITTYHLNNASTFGLPLNKIEYLQGYEWKHLQLYFPDSRFMALRPYFKLPQLGEYTTIEQNDANGYEVSEVGYVYLKFDKSNNSITCGSGL